MSLHFDFLIRNALDIDNVIVNGVPVWRDRRCTGARPGRVLRAGAAAFLRDSQA